MCVVKKTDCMCVVKKTDCMCVVKKTDCMCVVKKIITDFNWKNDLLSVSNAYCVAVMFVSNARGQ